MEKLVKITAIVLMSLLPLVILTFFINIELYNEIIKEDGLIEYLTALLLLSISLLLVNKLIKVKFSKGYKWFIFNLILVLGLFFGFGEEISWGQRIFGVTSSEFFTENNLQGETNFHNLMINGVKINEWIFTYAFSILFGFYFFLLLIVYKNNAFVKNTIDGFGLPIPKFKHTVIFVVITIIIMIIPDGKKWELWECLFALVLLMIFVEPYNVREKLLLTENTRR